TRRCSSAGKRPPSRCWTGCRGCWRASACWGGRGFRGGGRRRCCGGGGCRGSRGGGWRAGRGARGGPVRGFPRPRRRLGGRRRRVAPLAGADAAAVRRELDADPARFALTARQAALAGPPGPAGDRDSAAAERDQPSRRLLLVVDQFEELFTQCADEAPRRAFI